MNAKRWLERTLAGLFALCIGFALIAALETFTQARERPYLLQAAYLLGYGAVIVVLANLMRAWGRLAPRIPARVLRIADAIAFVAILVLGGMLRLYVIRTIELEPESDFATYYRLGSLLSRDQMLRAEGLRYRAYVSKFPHTIGFPSMVLAPVFRIFGESVRVALYANLVLSLGAMALVYAIGRKAFGRGLGLIAMTAAAVWPSHVLYASMVASEQAFTFLLLLGVYLLVISMSGGAAGHKRPLLAVVGFIACGVVLGIANAVRPMALIMVIAIAMMLVLRNEKLSLDLGAARQILSRGWLCALIVALSFSLTAGIATNNVHSMIRMEPVGGMTASGYNLMVGTNATHKGVWNAEDAAFFDNVYEETGSAEEAHRASMEVGISRIVNSPEDTFDLFIYKYRDLWQTDDFGIDWNLLWAGQQDILTPELNDWLEGLRPVSRGFYFILLMLVLIAAAWQWRAVRVDPMCLVFMLFFIGTALLHMVLETQVRYHYNMIPILIMIGGYALQGWRFREKDELAMLEAAQQAQALETNSAQLEALANPTPLPAAEEAAKSIPNLEKAARSGNVLITMTEVSARLADQGMHHAAAGKHSAQAIAAKEKALDSFIPQDLAMARPEPYELDDEAVEMEAWDEPDDDGLLQGTSDSYWEAVEGRDMTDTAYSRRDEDP